MAATEQVILVDSKDQPIGTIEKMQAHREGLCHRAFSVFILRKERELEVLLQQRAKSKYHSPHLWTNSCCSHPRPGEAIIPAAERRLKEELGFSIPLQPIGCFHYIAHFTDGLIENEIDHVLIGTLNDHQAVRPDSAEVQDFRWVTFDQIQHELAHDPKRFTPWFQEALNIVQQAVLL